MKKEHQDNKIIIRKQPETHQTTCCEVHESGKYYLSGNAQDKE